MAGSSLLMLLDDIAMLLDDIAVMTKVAAKKTAGVLGDDLALNAKQVEGIAAARELPVVWAVAKGSLINKAIIIPLAMVLSFFAPSLILPLLMLGGAYLCFEGAEKFLSKWLHAQKDENEHKKELEALMDKEVNMVEYEKEKIKGAIRTDFILSAEIMVISLNVVAQKSYAFQLGVLVLVGFLMTVFVYGLVGLIVKLDDMGFALKKSSSGVIQKLGDGLIKSAPMLMKVLAVAGTVAMFLVGGEFIVHGIDPVHHTIEHWGHDWGSWVSMIANGVVGFVSGVLIVVVLEVWTRFASKVKE